MKYAICNLSVVPVRGEAKDSSEMVTQLLFGELMRIKQQDKQWLYIKIEHDGYEGWIDEKQVHLISDAQYEKINSQSHSLSLDLVHSAITNSKHLPLCFGSVLPFYDGMSFKLDKQKIVFNGLAMLPDVSQNGPLVEKIAKKYLGAPYLWGGRSPFGIDCSGFTQNVFRFLDIPLKRDAYQQAEAGTIVNMIQQARPGDLAFFQNGKPKISHVGIILPDNKIIHAHGKVRIDTLDNYGIHNAESKKYTHQLKCIKRVF